MYRANTPFFWVHSLLAVLTLHCTAVFAEKPTTQGAFEQVYMADAPRVLIPSAKKALVRDGMTMRELVNGLGMAWLPSNEGVGHVRWMFDDGFVLVSRFLYPPDYKLHFDGDIWWERTDIRLLPPGLRMASTVGQLFNPAYHASAPRSVVPASKKSAVKDGIKLGSLVTALGQGWYDDMDNTAIKWNFSDGSILEVWPENYCADNVIHFGPGKTPSLMRWIAPPPSTLPPILLRAGYWSLAAVGTCIIGVLLYRMRRRISRIKRGCCVNCGYDLRGGSVVCPECGRTAPVRMRDK